MGNLDYCNDGDSHQWRSDPGNPDGMVCGGCGVSEAELGYLIRQEQRRKREGVPMGEGHDPDE